MESNQQGLPLPDELDDRQYYFIREHNDQGVALRRLSESLRNGDRDQVCQVTEVISKDGERV